MSSLNSCSFIGRCGKDAEVTYPSGTTIAKFSIAVSEKYKDKSGEAREDTQWINCTCFGKLAEIVEKYVKKGDLLYINGKLKTRSWEKDGEKKYATEIVVNEMKMLGGKKSDTGTATSQEATFTDTPSSYDSEVPF